MVAVLNGRGVVIDESGRIDVVHHQIQSSVVIQIGVGGAVREAGLAHSPRLGTIGECEIPFVPEDVVGLLIAVQLLQEIQSGSIRRAATPPPHGENGGLIIQIIRRLGIAITDENVLVPVVVEIGKEGTPTPVRGGHSRKAGDFAEHDVAVTGGSIAQLQCVHRVVIA